MECVDLMNNPKHIRIKDIAEKAGCSIGTVDRVIHKRGKVAEEVRQRVLRIMEELDYKPNLNARVLAQKQALSIGILLPSFRKGDYWELPNKGIRDAISRFEAQGYRIHVLEKTYHGTEQFFRNGMALLKKDVDGIITNPVTFKESIRLMRAYFQHRVPVILIDSDIPGTPSLTFIGKDPTQSGATAGKLIHQITRHIRENKRIWVVNVSRKISQMYALLGRETGFMNFFYERELQDEYAFRTFDMEDQGRQSDFDIRLEEMIREGVPHAIYVTGSRVHRIASSLKKLKPEPRPLLIGHDLIQANRRGVEDESIDFIIEEEAHRQGYLAVESMIRSVILKEHVEKKQWMNLLIYTSENLPSDPAEHA